MRSAHFGALRNLGAFLAVMASHAANALRLRNVRNWLSGMQPIEPRLRFLQITRVKPFGKPPVDRSKCFASLLRLALVTPEACEAHGGAEFPGFSLLLTGDGESSFEILLCFI